MQYNLFKILLMFIEYYVSQRKKKKSEIKKILGNSSAQVYTLKSVCSKDKKEMEKKEKPGKRG